eukprot:13798452-Alexandrium_andersonii.AAC.1
MQQREWPTGPRAGGAAWPTDQAVSKDDRGLSRATPALRAGLHLPRTEGLAAQGCSHGLRPALPRTHAKSRQMRRSQRARTE